MPYAWRPSFGLVGTTSTNVIVDISSFALGDLMFLTFGTQAGMASITPPAGWIEIFDVISTGTELGAGYYKVKTASDGSTATFVASGVSGFYGYCITALYDTNIANDVGILAATIPGTPVTSNTSILNFPAIPAPGAANYIGVAFATSRGGTNAVPYNVSVIPSGWTLVAEVTNPGNSNNVHSAIFAKNNISSSGESIPAGQWSNFGWNANCSMAILPTLNPQTYLGIQTLSEELGGPDAQINPLMINYPSGGNSGGGISIYSKIPE